MGWSEPKPFQLSDTFLFMTFLSPLFLLGLSAAAIPLIIHLFNFRKPQTIRFSSLAFLHELEKSTMRRVRIKQWLLLALRILAIALLVLAFARPVATGGIAGALAENGKISRAIIMDNSMSMTLRDDSGVYLDQEKRVANRLVQTLGNGDEAFIIPTISMRTGYPGYLSTSAAERAVHRIESIPGTGILSTAISRAGRALSGSANPNRELFILTDMQESTLVDSLQVDMDPDVSIFLIPIGTRHHENVAISDIQVISRILSVGQPVGLEIQLENNGERPATDLLISVFLDDERVAQSSVDVGPDRRVTVPIAVTPRQTGWLRGNIQIDDGSYPHDDSRSFTLFVPRQRKILLVEGEGTNQSLLELALRADLDDGAVGFSVQVVTASGLARQTMEAFDAVILSGVHQFSTGERASITRYVAGGGGVLIYPGEDMDLTSYNEVLDDLGGGDIIEIIGGKEEDSTVGQLESIDFGHPIFDGMFEESAVRQGISIEQPLVYRAIDYRPGGGQEDALIRLSGGRPFLEEIRTGAGSLLLYAVSVDSGWSEFPVRGLFIPLLYRSLHYLSASSSVTGESFDAGAAASVRIPGLIDTEDILVEDDAEEVFSPVIRRIPGAVLLSVEPGILTPGIYDIRVRGDIIRSISVHDTENESRLRGGTPETTATVLSEKVHRPVRVLALASQPEEEFAERLREIRSGVELWNVFLMLALVSLIAEMILEKTWRPESA